LLEFVASFHANRAQAGELEQRVNLRYVDLGAKITAWCREQQRRPTK
jgi:hypothetical protein